MEGAYGYNLPPEPGRSRLWARLRVFGGILTAVFAVTLAVLIGQRLSDQAMAVLAGAVCGVGASIPTSLLIAWITQRRREQQPTQITGAYPPVIVVQPPPQPGLSGPTTGQPGYLAPFSSPMQREFTVVGSEGEEVRYGRYQ